ncbi:ABC transporter ATP-binding protein [Streptomyces sp. NBC_00102]|uniref:dipeptide ABC transporter ATP-binding protein n=1 Tax=Streptomyces sp. NBC_00102 TaxID=2975652 RepID=UPI002251BF44|nr:ABC transporter ATP-binding protein [Streptomyces sp. NBC_00102]MCX5395717.1 ABC transporter ATP-binding protein [Streptomyces sp. NBC_00102]
MSATAKTGGGGRPAHTVTGPAGLPADAEPAARDVLLAVDGLRVAATTRGGGQVTLLDGMSLRVGRGECVGIVGESGSGKSLAMRAVAGLLPAGTTVTGGTVRIGGEEVLGLPPEARHALRGRRVTLLMQDPFTMLHPQLTCGRQIADGLRERHGALRGRRNAAARRAEVVRRLAEVGLGPEAADRYPHELSGGMRQRVAAAAALAGDPELLIADEPTTALDAANQRAVLDLLRGLQRDRGMGLVLISHDLRVAFSACDRVYVLYAGAVLEHGRPAALESAPAHPYTAGLLASEPSADRRFAELHALPGFVPPPGRRTGGCPFAERCAYTEPECRTTRVELRPVVPEGPAREAGAERLSACVRLAEIGDALAAPGERAAVPTAAGAGGTGAALDDAVLAVTSVSRTFRSAAGDHTALRDVSLTVAPGSVLALVGESGSGKTTLARVAIGLETFDGGEVRTGGVALPAGRRPDTADRRRLAAQAQIVFQDPYASLNPLRTVGATLREALAVPGGRRARDIADADVEKLLSQVGLPAAYAARRPAALSGGERQRVAVARALAARPRLLICDEAVAALDVSVQAQLLNLLDSLRRSEGFAILFITHDLAVVRQMADRVAVMYRGEVVEQGRVDEVLDAPRHPWTRRMLDALPERGDRAGTPGPARG